MWVAYIHGEIRLAGGGGRLMQIVILVPRLNNLGTRPQKWSSLGMVSLRDHAQCTSVCE